MPLAPLKMTALFRPNARLSLYLYISLRLFQFGAMGLTLSYFCSLIGYHRAHFCSERFYKDRCTRRQQELADVPTLYVIFVVTYAFMIPAAIVLTCRQLSSFLHPAPAETAHPQGSIRLPDDDDDSSSSATTMATAAIASIRHHTRAFRAAQASAALFLDSAALLLLSAGLHAYWARIIRPNHMHPGSGYTIPVCWLFESTWHGDDAYWMNLSVPKMRCMDNQVSFYGTVGVMGFTLLLVVLEGFYVRYGAVVGERALVEGGDGCDCDCDCGVRIGEAEKR